MAERPAAGAWTPPDQPARDRIAADLHTSLLVEAGAGSGKTHAMVERMVRLVATGTATVDRVAAVTFTRKAAGELRERFQVALEQAFAAAAASAPEGAEATRLHTALGELDRAFIGTIHAFCARLLRERPLEAGIPPAFEEISGPDEDRLRGESWTRFLERVSARGGRLLEAVRRVGLRPAGLAGVYRELADNPDVAYPAERVPAPDELRVRRCRAALERLLDDTLAVLPDEEPAAGWDALQRTARRLRAARAFGDWGRLPAVMDAVADAVDEGASIAGGAKRVTYNRWNAPRDDVKELEARWAELPAGSAADALRAWRAHRYPIALRFARTAAAFYARERLRSGRLTFADLLVLAARMLAGSEPARRELGERYRYLLVDEFQDTDPLQAEVLLLLAAADGEPADWTRATPRPGALFVVGDPKQSIYRFRRADISIYNQVKERFERFGAVLTLDTNFRSTPPLERLVERVFAAPGALPPAATEHQAAFAPLRVGPCDAARAARSGIRWYGFETPGKGGFSGKRIHGPDAANVASWIAGEIESGRRAPGDFMVLTRTKACLHAYAGALEARGVPVQASGAGVGMEEELRELVLLLDALLDPSDEVATLAVLEGLFFGLSHAELFEHVRMGGRLDLTRGATPAGSPAAEALGVLERFWRMSGAMPAEPAVASIVAELGLLPHAVAAPLGGARAGALLYALDALRTAGLRGRSSLAGAVEVLRSALEQEVDTPLIPGRGDVVRVMNLHKAKGLEAPVVVLAYPARATEHPVWRHVTRRPDGSAAGFLCVRDEDRLLAAPAAWDEHAAVESAFEAAEQVRLLYVAVTRARDELIVARCDATRDGSHWSMLHDALDDPTVATELRVELRDDALPSPLEATAAELAKRVRAVDARRAALRRAGYRAAPVTARAKGAAGSPDEGAITLGDRTVPSPSVGGGLAWGRVVHRAMEAAARGLDDAALAALGRSLLMEEERPCDERGEPTELRALLELVGALRDSTLLARALRSERLLVEVPFTLALPAAEAAAAGLAGAEGDGDAAPVEVVEGVIDLVFADGGGWVVADYKTDANASAEARAAYRRQVDLYALCWERISGAPVAERILVWTAEGREERW